MQKLQSDGLSDCILQAYRPKVGGSLRNDDNFFFTFPKFRRNILTQMERTLAWLHEKLEITDRIIAGKQLQFQMTI